MRFDRTIDAVREFLAALADPHTYAPMRNSYVVFGFLWGLPIPIFSCAIDGWATGRSFTLGLLWEHPVQIFFLAHPILFAVVFGAMGTVRWTKDRQIQGLIADLERHVKELDEANVRLRELDHLKAQFVANVTHELKTPLVSIRGYNESILEGRFGPISEKQRDGLTVAMRNIVRLQNLIAEVLEFERIDAGELRLDRSDFDLFPLVQEAVESLRPKLDAKRLSIELAMPAGTEVNADREQISRVLLNLIANAVKFSPEGGTLGIDAHVEEGGTVQVTVWDRGSGIPAGLQKHLFTRFWQATKGLYQKGEGTGLGLVISRGILEAHGGTIEVVSSERAGTQVHFRLKRADAAGSVPAREARPEPGRAAPGPEDSRTRQAAS